MPKTLAASFKSVGMAIAPAITLNRMYHCVPSSSRTIEPNPKSSAQADQDQQHDREQRRGRNRGGDLREGLRDARQARIESDGDADGDGPERAEQQA